MVDVFATAFPDIHPDIHHVYETSDRGIDVTPNTNQAVTRRRVRRNASGVVPCQRLNARWKPVGSE